MQMVILMGFSLHGDSWCLVWVGNILTPVSPHCFETFPKSTDTSLSVFGVEISYLDLST